MTKRIEKANVEFVEELGKFVKRQRERMTKNGISGVEFNAISTTTFQILGRHSKRWREEAGLK